jgi:fused signal recognition particle receptor
MSLFKKLFGTGKTDQSNVEESPSGLPAEGSSFLTQLKKGLSKTREHFSRGFSTLFLGRKEIDEALIEDIETLLLTADVGTQVSERLMQEITERLTRKELKDPQVLMSDLREALLLIAKKVEQPLEIPKRNSPFVILMIGVNGAGKTTTIGKLTHRLLTEGKTVLLAAGDTFRAAAVEQLKAWGEKNEVPVIAQSTGSDSAAVIFDALNAAKSRGVDVVIADTAGRLHNKSHLMAELAKVKKVIQKCDPEAPHEVMLVLDAGNGQNALVQAAQFHEFMGVTGITLTKLDGTAKGGIVFAVAEKFNLPLRFIGVGESVEDLQPFQAESFVSSLFESEG